MTNNNDYSAYVGMGHNQPSDLPEITKLAQAQHVAQVKVKKLEAELKVAKEELRQIAEKRLPEAMDSVGITTYTTKEGVSVEISEKIRASLPVENRPKAFAWLEENGFGGMIKSEVIVNFGRSKIDDATKLVEELRAESHLANLERRVEPMTLTAFVKEQLTQGKELPLDIFGVFRQRIAEVEV